MSRTGRSAQCCPCHPPTTRPLSWPCPPRSAPSALRPQPPRHPTDTVLGELTGELSVASFSGYVLFLISLKLRDTFNPVTTLYFLEQSLTLIPTTPLSSIFSWFLIFYLCDSLSSLSFSLLPVAVRLSEFCLGICYASVMQDRAGDAVITSNTTNLLD